LTDPRLIRAPWKGGENHDGTPSEIWSENLQKVTAAIGLEERATSDDAGKRLVVQIHYHPPNVAEPKHLLVLNRKKLLAPANLR